jgi:5'-methylthioadenosine phosphorylase
MGERILGVIGGSGLYELPGLDDIERRRVRTPFGDPSDELVVGRLGDVRLVFLPRHDRVFQHTAAGARVYARFWSSSAHLA